MKIRLSIFASLMLVISAQSFKGCSDGPNQLPLIQQDPVFVAKTSHGSRYLIQDKDNATNFIHIALLDGSAYEMGYAYGSLFKEELNWSVNNFSDYIISAQDKWIKALPAWLKDQQNMTTEEKIFYGLDLEEMVTKHYTPQRFLDQMKGMSDASGINYDFLAKINLFPELVGAACSMAGMWGPATTTGSLLQLRALDWDYSAPMSQFPLITVYNSNEQGANIFATFGWVGIIGTLAGYSPLVGVCEASNADLIDQTTVFGEPWMYVMRDVLEFATDLDDAKEILRNANRTYQIYLGVGAKEDNEMVIFDYDYGHLIYYTDKNFTIMPFPSWHQQRDGIVYGAYKDGPNHPCFNSVYEEYYGKLTPEIIYRYLAPMNPTGDTMLVVYDYEQEQIFISFADD